MTNGRNGLHFAKHFRRKLLSRILLHTAILYTVTFCLVLPYLCLDLPYSLYYRENWLEEKPLAELVNSAIDRRIVPVLQAHKYFTSIHRRQSDENLFHIASLRFAIGIITTRRIGSYRYPGYDPKYLTEVAARTHKILQRRQRNDSVLVICNVDPEPEKHKEAVFLAEYISSVTKTSPRHDGEELQDRSNMGDIHRKEQEDYLFCLKYMSKFETSYAIMLQEDALMQMDFFEVVEHLLKTRMENTIRRGQLEENKQANNVAALKLYFPEKWQGYSWDVSRIAELFLIGLVGGFLLSVAYTTYHPRIASTFLRRSLVVFLSVTYVQLVFITIGRHYVLELSRLSPSLYSLTSAPDCCIPAMVYNHQHIPSIIDFIESIECSRDYPIDIAISDFIRKAGLKHYLVVPNLVRHIGMFSTLHREPKDPIDFLDV